MMRNLLKYIICMLIVLLTVVGTKSLLYAQEPVNELAIEEPTGEESTDEEPTDEEPTGEESTTEKPTTEEPTTEEPTTEEPTTEEPTTEEPTTEEKEPVRVLFVGNSFTRSGKTDIGEMLETIAESQGENVETEVIVNPGFYLSYYTNTDIGRFEFHYQLVNALRDNQYDYIVFQESSFGCIEDVKGMYEAIEKLKTYVQYYQADVKMLLYITHPYQDGTTVKINDTDTVLSLKDRIKHTQAGYVYAGKEAEMKVVPAGIAFYRAYTAFPEISWYQEDKKHPSHAAFYAMACSFYKEIFGKQPVITDKMVKKAKLTIEEQQKIIGIAYNSLEFKETYKVLGQGEQFNIEYVFNDAKVENISFSSLNKNIASVKDGVVTANSHGTTAIVGRTASGSQAVCIVTVEDKDVKEKGISFVNNKHILEIGEKIKSIPRVSIVFKKHKLKWSTSNKSIAKVDCDGVVTAMAPGRAKITVKNTVNGKSASYYVYIRNKAPENLVASGVLSGKSVYNKLTWTKSADANYYVIYRSTKAGSGYVKIGTTNKLSYVDKTVERNKAYYYKVTAYKNHIMCESEQSEYAKGIALKASKLTVVSKSKKKVKIKWTKNNYATGYIIYRSNNKGKSYKKIATITSKKKVTFIDKNVKAKRNYYYIVQAYREIGDIVFYSNKSDALKVKVPKK